MIDLFVPGWPAPQGSRRYLGRSGGKGITVESSKAVAPWRADVRDCILATHTGGPLDGPVAVRLEFVMLRPASAPKRSTPAAVKRPDLDKLCRAVLDAIGSAGVWRDDSQVVDLRAVKRIAEIDERAGCRITIAHTTPELVGWRSTRAMTTTQPGDHPEGDPVTGATTDVEEWRCPKPGCDLGVDGHDFALRFARALLGEGR